MKKEETKLVEKVSLAKARLVLIGQIRFAVRVSVCESPNQTNTQKGLQV